MAEINPGAARPLPVIKVVGVSAAGKSTLVAALRAAGYDARPVSQEHTSVATLWQQFDPPFALFYLEVTLAAQIARRPDVTWTAAARAEELRRLAHAREHADLVLETTALEARTVLELALAWLRRRAVRAAAGPLPPVPPTGAPLRPAAPPAPNPPTP